MNTETDMNVKTSAYFTTNVRKSLIVCVKLNRPDSRLPSAKRICMGVVGCAVSNFNFSVALKDENYHESNNNKEFSMLLYMVYLQLFIFFILASRWWCGSCSC